VRQVHELEPGGFNARIRDERPLGGSVVPDHIFVLSPPGTRLNRASEAIPTVDPVTGNPASWIRRPTPEDHESMGMFARFAGAMRGDVGTRAWRREVARGGGWEEPIFYALRMLEAHLAANLASLLLIDDVALLVNEWRETGRVQPGTELGEADLVRLTTVMRDLARERVALVPETDAELRSALARPDYDDALAACRELLVTEA
jgi:hypothetical protein